ncbi:MAG: endonuclease/exonuclease/phosphatase family protein [Flavobacteriales bacterium]
MQSSKSAYKYSLTLLFLLIFQLAFAQQIHQIAFYNVENLFDTIDGPNDDAEFLPSAQSEWNSVKYQEKLQHIRQVMASLDMPIVMGVCEIENKAVLVDLIGKDNRYDVVHFESPDARGIDVGLLYRKDILKLKDAGKIRFVLPGDSIPSTRDIVWAQFQYKKEQLFVIVNHWPSRRGGTEESAPRRLAAAQQAAQLIDRIQHDNPKAKIIFMGDLNDHPQDVGPQLIAQKLIPQITKSSNSFGGSYNYKNEWDVLDHMMVSSNAFDGKIQIMKESGHIHTFPYLLTEYKGQIVPNRTYAGTKYLGGYSDHLPVSIQVILHP